MLQTLSPYRAGLHALAAGDPAAALPLLREACAAGEGSGFAHLNLGIALTQLGRLADAAGPLAVAVQALPGLAEAHLRLAQLLGVRGDPAAAAESFRAALRCDPHHPIALAGLAALEEGAGRPREALRLVAAAREVDPEEPELAAWAARLALSLGEPERAAAEARIALRAVPTHAEAARLLARALRLTLPHQEAAVEAAEEAAGGDPLSPAWPLVAAALHAEAGAPERAIAELRTALALAPRAAAIRAELGQALADAGRYAEAEVELRAALPARPQDMPLRNRLATVLWKAHRISEAVRLLDDAIADFGPEPPLLMNRALLVSLQGDQEEALATAERCVALTGGSLDALVTRLNVLPYHPTADAAALRAAAEAVGARMPLAPTALREAAAGRDPDRPLRVGLLSGNLSCHPVGWLTVAGIEALAEPEFTVAAYSLRPRQDVLAARFRARCALWRELPGADDATIATTIAEDGVDILLDLGGFGDGGRAGVIARRAAPVQVKWVGSQYATTGLPGMDWMLTDRWETPPGFEAYYTERLLRLPDGYACYAPPVAAPPVAPLPALARGAVTFGCFNNLAKLAPPLLAAWARILHALPEARLVLRTFALGCAETRAILARRLMQAGLPVERVEMHGGVPHPALLAAYGEIDIALDPFPYNGGLTVCEALWMGVPSVSLAGTGFAARHAVSHLSNVGLPDWVAQDADGYVDLAIGRARDLRALATLRAGLREQVRASPLCDAPRFGRSLGAALRHAWREHCLRPG